VILNHASCECKRSSHAAKRDVTFVQAGARFPAELRSCTSPRRLARSSRKTATIRWSWRCSWCSIQTRIGRVNSSELSQGTRPRKVPMTNNSKPSADQKTIFASRLQLSRQPATQQLLLLPCHSAIVVNCRLHHRLPKISTSKLLQPESVLFGQPSRSSWARMRPRKSSRSI